MGFLWVWQTSCNIYNFWFISLFKNLNIGIPKFFEVHAFWFVLCTRIKLILLTFDLFKQVLTFLILLIIVSVRNHIDFIQKYWNIVVKTKYNSHKLTIKMASLVVYYISRVEFFLSVCYWSFSHVCVVNTNIIC